MIAAILLLLGCQLVGEAAARLLSLPVPGPVIGLVVLLVLLVLRDRVSPGAAPVEATPLGSVTGFILANLSLLFVPAGTGIVGQAAVLSTHGIGLIVALVVSTVLTLVSAALVFRWVAKATGSVEEP